MAIIEASYLQFLQANAQQSVSVIIRVTDEPASVVQKLADRNLKVTATFKLVSAVAATGIAGEFLTLLDEDWVASIEPDQPVKAA